VSPINLTWIHLVAIRFTYSLYVVVKEDSVNDWSGQTESKLPSMLLSHVNLVMRLIQSIFLTEIKFRPQTKLTNVWMNSTYGRGGGFLQGGFFCKGWFFARGVFLQTRKGFRQTRGEGLGRSYPRCIFEALDVICAAACCLEINQLPRRLVTNSAFFYCR